MLNYEVDPAVLRPLVPRGTELDAWRGATYVSVVGFRFLSCRVLGVAIPFHTRFTEVNLRFYVRREARGEVRRGVVFVRELVPRAAIAWVARVAYHEPYLAVPMRHVVPDTTDGGRVAYDWQFGGRWQGLEAVTTGAPALLADGSEEQFITEHYWGYTRQPDGGTIEYRVEHPPWSVWSVSASRLDVDAAALYGDEFVESLSRPPRSVFVADGSALTVFRGERFAGGVHDDG
jgi:uncharacterized protein